jgi:1-acyl-sn-glycerol-3-phosphate acyltransferase
MHQSEPDLFLSELGTETSRPLFIMPEREELLALSRKERLVFKVCHWMNQGNAKRIWSYFQKRMGAAWINLATSNLLKVHGLENIREVQYDRPVLLVANHRSYFDMYVVSAVLYREWSTSKHLFFPVRGSLFYDSFTGMLINFLVGWWSMYPPIFNSPGKRLFDRYSMRQVVELCRKGAGHVIGFHPEGKRNLVDDPYSLLPAQPGVGKLIKESNPRVIPVFVAGLGNDIFRQMMANWTGGEPIRVHFGRELDLTSFQNMQNHVRTYKMIGELIMEKIADLAEDDRQLYGPKQY